MDVGVRAGALLALSHQLLAQLHWHIQQHHQIRPRQTHPVILEVIEPSKKFRPLPFRYFAALMYSVRRRVPVGHDKPAALTYKEFELLRLFLQNPGIAFTRDQLFDKVWGQDFYGETRTIDTHILTLRQKLGPYGGMIQTVRNVGYRFDPPETDKETAAAQQAAKASSAAIDTDDDTPDLNTVA